MTIDDLMNAKARQKINDVVIPEASLVIYTIENQKTAIHLAEKLRAKKIVTELVRKSKQHEESEYEAYAKANSICKSYSLMDTENVRIVDYKNDTDQTKTIRDLEASL